MLILHLYLYVCLCKILVMNKIFRCLAFIAILFCSCSGDDTPNVDFKITDAILTKGYWYSNIYLDDNYATRDGLEAIKFDVNGKVKRMQVEGLREYEAGNWKRSGNYITITNGDDVSEWRVYEEESDNDYLKIYVGNSAFKEFHLSYDFIKGLTADAFVVNEYVNNATKKSRFGYRLTGDDMVKVKALLPGKTVNLVEHNDVYTLDDKSTDIDYIDGASVEATNVRFTAIVDGVKVKLSDDIYAENIGHLDNANIGVNHTIGTQVVGVTWTEIAGIDQALKSRVRYRVELYPQKNGKKDVGNPVFISSDFNSDITGFIINSSAKGSDGKTPDFSKIKAGENFFVTVKAILYEQDIDPDHGMNKDINIQAISYYTRNESQW